MVAPKESDSAASLELAEPSSYSDISQLVRPGAKKRTMPSVTMMAMTVQMALMTFFVRFSKRKLIGRRVALYGRKCKFSSGIS
jgi:hypothetical protein